ncbi:MAG: alpha/beta hydrolase [Deltaproteobacteria bacterium]|nr:alpha/beta hydrolase [Deltaproteobacteria bacterium]
MTMREGRVRVNRMEIHYLAWNLPGNVGAPAKPGDGASLPLLLLHGFLDHAWSFVPFVDAFLEQSLAAGVAPRPVIAVNLRGHGDSDWVQGGYYHFPDYTLDVLGVADAVGAKRFALLGHSMGGMAACVVAGAWPERVAQLVVIEGVGPQAGNIEEAPDRYREWFEGVRRAGKREHGEVESLDAAAKSLQRLHPLPGDDLARYLAKSGTRALPDGRLVWKSDPLHRTRAPQPFHLPQAQAFFRRVECPVLFLTGGESAFRHFDVGDRLSCFRDLRTREIADAGHMVHHDQPGLLAEAVCDFISTSGAA